VKPRIVLFHPRVAAPEFHRLPWPILTLAGNLPRDRFEVVMVDGGKEPDPIKKLIDAAQGAKLVGISCFTGNQTVHALKAARALRRAHPALPIVWGGAHPSMHVEETLADPCVDVVVKGQGEETFVAVCEAIAEGEEPKDIPGASYKSARGEPVFGGRRKMNDQNRFGRPPFEDLDVSRYLVHILVGARAITYHSSTGCPFACQFCTVNFEFDFGWTGYSAERCVDELKHLFALAPQADAIEFADSNLIVSPKRTIELCQGMIEAGLVRPWIAFGRPDQLAKMPREVWKLMADSGCKRFFVGLESGDPTILAKIQKEHTVEQVYLMAERMAEFGIDPDLSFTLGYPEDPERDVRMSLDLCKDLKRIVPGSTFVLNTYTPYQSTPLFEDAVAHGLTETTSLSDWETSTWRDFGFRKNVTPWMTEDIDRLIRDFETVAGSAFFLEEDLYRFKGVQMRGRPLRDAMIALARRRWNKSEWRRPMALKLVRKLFFAMNPKLESTTPSLVDGHQAGVKTERPAF
jgi:anaerobic magnesium-protoporphyrin IX monomethyl ester cyclase